MARSTATRPFVQPPKGYEKKTPEYWDAEAAKAKERMRKAQDSGQLSRAAERMQRCELAAWQLRQEAK